jgi:hypothetical protein
MTLISMTGASVIARLSETIFDQQTGALLDMPMRDGVFQTVGMDCTQPMPTRAPRISSADRWFARRFFLAKMRGFSPVALHTDTAKEKMWALQNWGYLSDALRKRKCMAVLLGWPSRQLESSSLGVSTRSMSWQRQLAVLSESKLFIGVDSCFAHIADALGIPGLVLFGPTSAGLWGPQGPEVQLIKAPGGRMENLGLSAVIGKLFAIRCL